METLHSGRHLTTKRIALLAVCLLAVLLPVAVSLATAENDINAFGESYIVLSDGWTITDSDGNVSEIDEFPYIIEYGADGEYVLNATLPEGGGLIGTPVLELYSNYVDLEALVDGESVCAFPSAPLRTNEGTGNTWHYIRLSDFEGKSISVRLRCQLGAGITYQLDAPRIGSKASLLGEAVSKSMLMFMLASVMAVLALTLLVLYIALRKTLPIDSSTPYLSAFALSFGSYVVLESPYVKIASANGEALYIATLLMLAFMPPMLVGFFRSGVSKKHGRVSAGVLVFGAANLVVQSVLHMTRISNLRVMLPVTHIVIIACIAIMVYLMLRTPRSDAVRAKRMLLSSIPMIVGGCTDIALLWFGRPSPNNSQWFVIGVTLFILVQFGSFVSSYFATTRRAAESGALRSMAYTDTLTGLGNRNAYELRLKELGARDDPAGLGCIVADINKLKLINDVYGHSGGDIAIRETGLRLGALTPKDGRCYRTGGDEFVLLLEGVSAAGIDALISSAAESISERGRKLSLPLTLAASGGVYEEADGNIQDFIRRVDTQMYMVKRAMNTEAAPL